VDRLDIQSEIVESATAIFATIADLNGRRRSQMKKRMGNNRQCNFCPELDVDDLRYIYPVPDPERPGRTIDNTAGALACPACYPEQLQLQINYGLVILGCG